MKYLKEILLVIIGILVIYDIFFVKSSDSNLEALNQMKVQLDSVLVAQENYQIQLEATQDSLRADRELHMEMYDKIKIEARKSYNRYENTAKYLDSLNADVGILPDF